VEWYFGGEPVRDLATLTLDDFAPLKGDRFRVASFELELVEVNALPQDGFALVFAGGPAPPLPQGVQRVDHDALGPLDIFLVPVGPDRYEAVFT
jgi:hypothetical protein